MRANQVLDWWELSALRHWAERLERRGPAKRLGACWCCVANYFFLKTSWSSLCVYCPAAKWIGMPVVFTKFGDFGHALKASR